MPRPTLPISPHRAPFPGARGGPPPGARQEVPE